MKIVTMLILALFLSTGWLNAKPHNEKKAKLFESENFAFQNMQKEKMVKYIKGKSGLNESFEGSVDGWTVSSGASAPDNPWGIYNGGSYTTPYDGTLFAYYSCYNNDFGQEGHINTPLLSPTAGDTQLSFWVEYFLIEGDYGNTAELFVDVYDNSADTWYESSDNLIDGQHGAGWLNHTIDLNNYLGQNFTNKEVIVRYRAISDWGSYNIGLDLVVGPEIYVPADPIFSITPISKDFGTVLMNTTSSSQIFTIENEGGGTLTIGAGDVSLTGIDASQFTLTAFSGLSLATGETGNVEVAFAPTSEGAKTAALTINHNAAKGTAEIPLTGTCVGEITEVIIGDGTLTSLNLPIHPYFGYTYSQVIYLQSEINVSDKRIHRLSYHWNGSGSGTNSKQWEIYLGHTSKSIFTAVSDWIPLGNLTKVFDGTVNITAVDGWIDIDLDQSFIYNNSDNIVIAVYEKQPSYGSISEKFFGTPLPSNRSLLLYNDTSSLVVPSAPGNGNLVSGIANIKIHVEDLPTNPIFSVTPTSKNFGQQYLNSSSEPQTFTVTNTGSGNMTINPSDITLIGADANQFILSNIALTQNLTSGQSFGVNVAFNPTSLGNKTAQLQIVDNISKATNVVNLSGEGSDLVTIGTGIVTTLNLPLNPYYGYNYSQTIYYQNEINVSDQRIEKIYYYWNGINNGQNSKNWSIFMGHTDKVVFETSTDWIPSTGLTQVFTGDVSISATEGWIEIILDNPFIYNNIDNLVIAVDENSSGNDGSSTKFFGTSTVGVTRGLRYQSDSTDPNPATPPAATSVVSGIANIQLKFGEIPAVPTFSINPSTKDFGEIELGTDDSQVFTISNTGAGTLEISDIQLTGDASYSLTGETTASLANGETHQFTITFAPSTVGVKDANIAITDNISKAVNNVVITGEGYVRPAGSTCSNPYIVTFPLIDPIISNTSQYGNDYNNSMITNGSLTTNASTSYINGYDFIAQFTLTEPMLLNGSLIGASGDWLGLLILAEEPNLVTPAQVLKSTGCGSGTSCSITNFELQAGTYYAIVSTYPTPYTANFILNLSVATIPNPPQNLIATYVNGNNYVDLTWETPVSKKFTKFSKTSRNSESQVIEEVKAFTHYNVYKNNMKIAETTELTYKAENLSNGNYTFAVTAVHSDPVRESAKEEADLVTVNYDQQIVVTDLSYALENTGIWTPVDQIINETETLNFSITANDPDGNDLGYSWKVNGTEVSTIANYDFTTDYTSAGNYVVTLFVTDNFAKKQISSKKVTNSPSKKDTKSNVSYTWNVTVNDVDQNILVTNLNYANVDGGIWTPVDQIINETEALNFGITAIDPDGNNLEYSWKLGGTEVSTTANYDFTTNYTSAGSYVVTLNVTDNYAKKTSSKISKVKEQKSSLNYTWNVTVNDVDQNIIVNDLSYANNNSGVWTPIDQNINELQSLNFSIAAIDPDGNNLEYSWKLDGLEVSTTASYDYTTDYTNAGNHSITLHVSDNFTMKKPTKNDLIYTWNVVVHDIDQNIIVSNLSYANENSGVWAPVNQVINETEALNFSITAFDPDGNNLNFSWKLNGSVVSTTTNYDFLTGYESAGNYMVSLFVTDNYSKNTLTYIWSVTVNDMAQSVIITDLSYATEVGGAWTPNDQIINETESLSFSVLAYDPDGNDLIYSWKVNGIEASTISTYLFTTDYTSAGNYEIMLVLDKESKKLGTKSSTTFTWNVTVNDIDTAAPEITNISGTSWYTTLPMNVILTVSDDNAISEIVGYYKINGVENSYVMTLSKFGKGMYTYTGTIPAQMADITGVTYFYMKDEFNNSTTSSEYTIEWTTENISVPTNLAASVVSLVNVQLSWSTPVKNIVEQTKELLGYNVYREGAKIAENVPFNSYLDEDLAIGTYTYNVSAVYRTGESTLSASVEITIDNVPTETINQMADDTPSQAPWPNNLNEYTNTLDEFGWTSFDIVPQSKDLQMGSIKSIVASFTWISVDFIDEGTLNFKSPDGMIVSIPAIDLWNGEYDVPVQRVIALTEFIGKMGCGKWEVWISDSSGDGGHQILDFNFMIEIYAPIEIDNITLNSGWNMISSFIIPTEKDIEALFAPVQDHLIIMKNDRGQLYTPFYGGVNTIGNYDNEDGYQVKMDNSKASYSLEFSGHRSLLHLMPIAIEEGWNMIGYLKSQEMNVVDVMAPHVADIMIIKNGSGQFYIPSYGINTIGNMIPGKGYKLQSFNDFDLEYPADAKSVSQKKTELVTPKQTTHFQIPEITENNMTLVIPNSVISNLLDNGDEIAVFNESGICCGAVVYDDINTAVTVWEDDSTTKDLDGIKSEEKFYLVAWDESKQIELNAVGVEYVNNSGFYQTDAVVIVEKIDGFETFTGVEEILPTVTRLYQNYPNPFNPETTINFDIASPGLVTISVYNMKGELVKTLVNTIYDISRVSAKWNGTDNKNKLVANGVYFYKMAAPNYTKILKAVFVK
ncbi:MAG: choice-of-anchor D domain-containing protein [Candidatus Delongbacteria bacterium]|nr:choice-of-anchor D domain-containing protein [Candidatus Delongbacteria bacterium]MBN2833507.1 choice-of-anchor D domain-containing protein [Candidatus Delongbacteria bacterium]